MVNEGRNQVDIHTSRRELYITMNQTKYTNKKSSSKAEGLGAVG